MESYSTATTDPITADCVRRHRSVEVKPLHSSDDEDFPASPFRLGPVEHLTPAMIPIAVVYVYEHPTPSTAASVFLPAETLRRAMARLLCYYPQLSGRLTLQPNGDRCIERLDSGALLVEASCDKTLAELREGHSAAAAAAGHASGIAGGAPRVLSLFDLPAGSNALFAPYDPSPERIVQDALFTVQHTRFACGGVALGVRVSHSLCDAHGLFLVMRHLTELYRAVAAHPDGSVLARLDKAALPRWRPYLADFVEEAGPTGAAAALSRTPDAYFIAPPPPQEAAEAGAVDVAEPAAAPVAVVVGRELYFTAEQLAELKRRATPADGSGWVSTFEALNAFLWQSVYQARCAAQGGGAAAPPTDFLTAHNLRERFLASAAAADLYFPAGCLTPITTVDPGVLGDKGRLAEAAAALHAMLRTPDLAPAEVQHTLRWIAAQPDKTRIRTRFTPGGFLMSAWNKFDMYGSVVCDGVAPVLVSTPFTCISLVDGLGYVLPWPPAYPGDAGAGSADSGGLIVYLALAAPLWPVLQKPDLLGPHLR